MNRGSFLKNLLFGSAAAVVSPKISIASNNTKSNYSKFKKVIYKQ